MKKFLNTVKEIACKIIAKVKDYFYQKYFKKVECAHCRGTDMIHRFYKTSDGEFVCRNCMAKLPSDMTANAFEKEFEYFDKALDYVEYSKKELSPKFNPDLRYEDVAVDSENGLIRIGSWVIELSIVENCIFTFEPTEAKDGVFSAKVKGDVKALVITQTPAMMFNETVAFMVTGKAKKQFGTSIYIHDNPKKLDDFIEKFDIVWKNSKKQKLF